MFVCAAPGAGEGTSSGGDPTHPPRKKRARVDPTVESVSPGRCSKQKALRLNLLVSFDKYSSTLKETHMLKMFAAQLCMAESMSVCC